MSQRNLFKTAVSQDLASLRSSVVSLGSQDGCVFKMDHEVNQQAAAGDYDDQDLRMEELRRNLPELNVGRNSKVESKSDVKSVLGVAPKPKQDLELDEEPEPRKREFQQFLAGLARKSPAQLAAMTPNKLRRLLSEQKVYAPPPEYGDLFDETSCKAEIKAEVKREVKAEVKADGWVHIGSPISKLSNSRHRLVGAPQAVILKDDPDADAFSPPPSPRSAS